ncbi:helix-turn-helix transcriptional regulator [Acidaminococcus sp. HCP3S3_H5]|uniref:helix-turn-helix transcriptional regulator n=1 Tax=Acidaminococcus sp. HCP3S3_H5 TaxID=3438733 RepID=UPI003F8ED8C5
MPEPKEIGERLRKLRGEIDRSTVAQGCGISVSAVSMYENGIRVPRDEIKVRLAKFYGKTVESIFY